MSIVFCSYLIIIKSLIPNVVESIYHDLTSPDTNPPEWALSSHNWLILIMLILVPLSFFRKLDHLRHTSYVAMFSVGESHRFCSSLLLKATLVSILGHHRHYMLLQTAERCYTGGKSSFDPFLTQLCEHVPCASICVYVRTQCKAQIVDFAAA